MVILLGIVVEAWSAIHFWNSPPSITELLSRLSADALIGAGLLIEAVCILRAIVWTRKEKDESDRHVAVANERAEQAVLETARLQSAMQDREIVLYVRDGDAEIRAARFADVKEYAGTLAVIQHVPDDREARRLARLIQFALTQSGWIVETTTNVPWGLISEGVSVLSLEEMPSNPNRDSVAVPLTSISVAGHAANAVVKLLELDLGPPYGPPLGGVSWSPTFAPFMESTVGDFVIPPGAIVILVGSRPFRRAFAWPVTPTTPAKTEK